MPTYEELLAYHESLKRPQRMQLQQRSSPSGTPRQYGTRFARGPDGTRGFPPGRGRPVAAAPASSDREVLDAVAGGPPSRGGDSDQKRNRGGKKGKKGKKGGSSRTAGAGDYGSGGESNQQQAPQQPMRILARPAPAAEARPTLPGQRVMASEVPLNMRSFYDTVVEEDEETGERLVFLQLRGAPQ